MVTQTLSVTHLGAPPKENRKKKLDPFKLKTPNCCLPQICPQFFDSPSRHSRRRHPCRQPCHSPCVPTRALRQHRLGALHQLQPSTTTSATFATCRACSSSATAHAAAAQPTQPAPVSTAARTATGSASLAAAAPRAPTCPNAQVAMNNWLGPQRCPLSTRARSARHNCRRRAPRLRRSRRRPRRACARPPPGARHCAP